MRLKEVVGKLLPLVWVLGPGLAFKLGHPHQHELGVHVTRLADGNTADLGKFLQNDLPQIDTHIASRVLFSAHNFATDLALKMNQGAASAVLLAQMVATIV
jgi:hypothetical protein